MGNYKRGSKVPQYNLDNCVLRLWTTNECEPHGIPYWQVGISLPLNSLDSVLDLAPELRQPWLLNLRETGKTLQSLEQDVHND